MNAIDVDQDLATGICGICLLLLTYFAIRSLMIKQFDRRWGSYIKSSLGAGIAEGDVLKYILAVNRAERILNRRAWWRTLAQSVAVVALFAGVTCMASIVVAELLPSSYASDTSVNVLAAGGLTVAVIVLARIWISFYGGKVRLEQKDHLKLKEELSRDKKVKRAAKAVVEARRRCDKKLDPAH